MNVCVKQSKELEAIHHKLEESHHMMLQMRDTRAWGEDQDRAFQGEVAESLTPQMFLTRLSLARTQARAQGVDKTPECKHAMRLRVR